MLLQNDSFRDLNAWLDQLSGRSSNGQWPMPMDAYKRGEDLWVHIDLPGISADSVDIDVERNVLTVTAQRNWQRRDGDQVYLTERPRGTFRRQVHLGDGLDADRIEADYHDGVLTLRIPVAETARPRKIAVNTATQQRAIDADTSEAAGEPVASRS
jgi:HSP20 family protein